LVHAVANVDVGDIDVSVSGNTASVIEVEMGDVRIRIRGPVDITVAATRFAASR